MGEDGNIYYADWRGLDRTLRAIAFEEEAALVLSGKKAEAHSRTIKTRIGRALEEALDICYLAAIQKPTTCTDLQRAYAEGIKGIQTAANELRKAYA